MARIAILLAWDAPDDTGQQQHQIEQLASKVAGVEPRIHGISFSFLEDGADALLTEASRLIQNETGEAVDLSALLDAHRDKHSDPECDDHTHLIVNHDK